MKVKSSNKGFTKGFTLIELLYGLGIFFIVVGIVGFGLLGIGCMGNQWFTAEGVLREIRMTNPKATEVLTYKRNLFKKSTVTVKLDNNTRQVYSVESNLLFNYTVVPLQQQ